MNLAQCIDPEWAHGRRGPRHTPQRATPEATAPDPAPAVFAPPSRPGRKPGAFQAKLIAAMADGTERTLPELSALVQSAQPQVYITLRRLIAVGEVVRSGPYRKTVYRLVDGQGGAA